MSSCSVPQIELLLFLKEQLILTEASLYFKAPSINLLSLLTVISAPCIKCINGVHPQKCHHLRLCNNYAVSLLLRSLLRDYDITINF